MLVDIGDDQTEVTLPTRKVPALVIYILRLTIHWEEFQEFPIVIMSPVQQFEVFLGVTYPYITMS